MLESYHIEYRVYSTTHIAYYIHTLQKHADTCLEHTKIYSSMELQHVDILQPASVLLFIIHLVYIV